MMAELTNFLRKSMASTSVNSTRLIINESKGMKKGQGTRWAAALSCRRRVHIRGISRRERRGERMFTPKGMAAEYGADYHGKDSYYYSKECPGQYSGSLAKEMGLIGDVQKEQWKNIVFGKDPNTGIELVGYKPRMYQAKDNNKKPLFNEDGTPVMKMQEREGGTDCTFSLGKSFSVIMAFKDSDDPRLRDLAEKIDLARKIALEKTAAMIEKNFVAARVSENGQVRHDFTGKAIYGSFTHFLSREMDCQWHDHLFLVNMTETSDGKKRAIDNDTILKNQRYIGAYHMSEFAVSLKIMGVPLQDTSHGNVEIAGVPKEIIAAASKRSKQIEAALPELRAKYPSASESRLREIACLATRSKKELVKDMAEWRKKFREECKELGFSAKNIADNIDKAKDAAIEKYAKLPNAYEAVREAARVMSFGESVFSQKNLVLQAQRLFPSGFRVADLEKAASRLIKDGPEIKDLDGPCGVGAHITTAEMQTIEAENVAMAIRGMGTVKPLMDMKEATERAGKIKVGNHTLTESQIKTYATVMSTRDRVMVIQGFAGTGKTTLFKQLNKDWTDRHLKVRGLASMKKAAYELQNTSGIKSLTIHSFLQSGEQMQANTVYIIEEASMLGSRQAHELLSMAEKAGARVILNGDRWQIPSISAGRVFADIQDHAKGISQAELSDIIRQGVNTPEQRVSQTFIEIAKGYFKREKQRRENSPEHKKSEDVINKKIDRLVDALEKAGSIIFETDNATRSNMAIDEVLKDWKNSIFMTNTNAQVRSLGQRIHNELHARGEIGQKETTVTIKEPKSFTNEAERHFVHNYDDGEYIQVNKEWEGGPKRGNTLQIVGRKEVEGVLIVQGKLGKKYEVNIREHAGKTSAYNQRDIKLSMGDKIMFLKNEANGNGALGIHNSEVAYIKSVSDDGKILVVERQKDGKNSELTIPLKKYNFLRYGTAGTVDKNQGATAPNAVGLDPESFQRAYVQGTREKQKLLLFVKDIETLRAALKNFLKKASTLDHKQPERMEGTQQPGGKAVDIDHGKELSTSKSYSI